MSLGGGERSVVCKGEKLVSTYRRKWAHFTLSGEVRPSVHTSEGISCRGPGLSVVATRNVDCNFVALILVCVDFWQFSFLLVRSLGRSRRSRCHRTGTRAPSAGESLGCVSHARALLTAHVPLRTPPLSFSRDQVKIYCGIECGGNFAY